MESVLENDNFKGYHHIFESQCFKNAFGKIMVKFFNLTDQIAAKDTNEVIDYYYHHIFIYLIIYYIKLKNLKKNL